MPVHNTRSALAAPPRHTIASMMGMSGKFQRRTLNEPCPYVLPNQMVGVELEYENAREAARRMLDPAVSSGYWNVTSDASLREHGEEFVLREGLEGLELAYAIREFFTITSGAGLRESGRTSCHVHLDMRDAHIELLRATVLVYQAVEKMFWSLVHRQRRWTGYCIPLAEAQGQLIALLFSSRATSGGNILRAATESVTRYSGLNVASISRHGTVEFRHFNNPVNEAQMNEWINICMAVRMAGTELMSQSGTTGVLAYVNEDTSRVITAVQSNTILAAACARAGMTAADMQLEIDQLLAITESIFPTGVVNNSNGAFVERTTSELSEIFGHSSGIRFRNNGVMSDYNKPKLTQQVKQMFLEFGMLGARAADYSSRYCNEIVLGGWPRDRDGQQRSWVRTRLLAFLAGNIENSDIDDVAEEFEERLFSVWEGQADVQDSRPSLLEQLNITQAVAAEEVREYMTLPQEVLDSNTVRRHGLQEMPDDQVRTMRTAENSWLNSFLPEPAANTGPEPPLATTTATARAANPYDNYRQWALEFQRQQQQARSEERERLVLQEEEEQRYLVLDNVHTYGENPEEYVELDDNGEPI